MCVQAVEYTTLQTMPFKLTPILCHVISYTIYLYLYICINLGIKGKCCNTLRGTIVEPSTNLLVLHVGHTSTCLCVFQKSTQLLVYVATPLWPSVRMKLTLPKLRTWSPPGLLNH